MYVKTKRRSGQTRYYFYGCTSFHLGDVQCVRTVRKSRWQRPTAPSSRRSKPTSFG